MSEKRNMNEIYLIGDLARLSGFSIDTLNYYLRIGLFKAKGRSMHNRYRYFDNESLELLNKIKEQRAKHMPIRYIKRRIEDGIL
ncbi:MAG: MerR family transcriptional regulator [Candidatus Marinimicrobia bacterium]|nr:MerR family transcriptional regulator [Candidatus Neomarinimicrobiota bacterium]MCH7955524.1 MerR family transcriptional regulator [Candidatus Neomarinimicrobiota bacterium]